MGFKIIVGVPSFNEADTISKVVQDIDNSLSLLKYDVEAKIVNSDNNSTDLTVEKVMQVATLHEKKSIHTTRIGKGANLKNIFEFALYDKADAVIFMDSDLAFVSKDWIDALTAKLISGCDAVFTRRIPIWNRGDLTYHLTYPLISTFWGANIHQPISGDFGFSSSFIKNALEHNWANNILGYGVDFFLASIATSFNWCEIVLEGKKDHKLRSYSRDKEGFITMNPKFSQVMFTARNLMRENMTSVKNTSNKAIDTNTIGEIGWKLESAPLVDNEIEELKLSIQEKYFANSGRFKILNHRLDDYFSNRPFYGIPNTLWVECLKDFVHADYNNIQMDLIETIFLSRVVGFYYEILGIENWYSVVESNAEEFRAIKI